MCLREIATNIVKHSQAKNCTILFQLTNGSLIVRVRDDGIGFPDNVSYGNGIHGIIERLSLIEGELSIQSDKFTEYMMTIPLVKKKEKEEMVI